MRVAGPLLDFPTELKNRLFPLKVCNPFYFLPSSITPSFAWLPYLTHMHYLVNDILYMTSLNLLMRKMSTLTKNCDVVDDIVGNIGVCGA